jgi:Fe-S oxidoreductase
MVPGLELAEMADSRKKSMCCGGGGGRIWMDTPQEERFSDLRLKQCESAGAEVLVTACPYCITNFEESRNPAGLDYGDVMVVGGGISGIQASLDLATAGFKVYLVEKSPAIGGHMAQLDKTYPTNDCSM